MTERFMPFPISDTRLPFWTQAPNETECNICEKAIAKGERVFYYPSVCGTWCETCGPLVKPIDPDRLEE